MRIDSLESIKLSIYLSIDNVRVVYIYKLDKKCGTDDRVVFILHKQKAVFTHVNTLYEIFRIC